MLCKASFLFLLYILVMHCTYRVKTMHLKSGLVVDLN